MKTFMRIICLYLVIGFYVGCSPVKFGLDTSACEKVGQACTTSQDGKLHFDNTQSVAGGKVDILIVDDNSASMSFEQKALASRFAGFIAQLDAKSVDYRIGITTTDVHEPGDGNNPSPANGNGAFQNGNLIPFASGVPYLTPSVANRATLFNSTIVRPETAACENFIANTIASGGIAATNTTSYSQQYPLNCPSGDERGIYAANLTVVNNPNSFIRPEANLAIIFLSDEDERSQLYGLAQYALGSNDQPTTLINNIRATVSGKKATIHAIAVKDNACLAIQNNQILGTPPVPASQGFVKGSIGSQYLSFPQQGWGKAADICASDYTTQLGEINSAIQAQISRLPLACATPLNLAVTLTTSDNTITWTQQGTDIVFSKQLPIGSSVRLVYDCDSI